MMKIVKKWWKLWRKWLKLWRKRWKLWRKYENCKENYKNCNEIMKIVKKWRKLWRKWWKLWRNDENRDEMMKMSFRVYFDNSYGRDSANKLSEWYHMIKIMAITNKNRRKKKRKKIGSKYESKAQINILPT